MKRIFSAAILISWSFFLHAQTDRLDSLRQSHDTARITFYTHSLDSLHYSGVHDIDGTIISGFQRYNPLHRKGNFYASLGNSGLAHRNLLFKPGVFNDFRFGINSFGEYIYEPDNIPYYNHLGPVTYLRYTSGPMKEQLFHAAHARNIGRNFMLGADVNVINSPGSYYRQKSDNRSLFLTGQFRTNDKRYGIIAVYDHNKFIWQENGGIVSDSAFENNEETNRRAIDINLQNAENLIKQSDVFVNQEFFLSKAPENDSTEKKTFHAGRISHHFLFHKQSQIYTDNDPANSFYHPFDSIIDSTGTFDSVFVRKFENKLAWTNLRVGELLADKKILISLGARHQRAEVSGYSEKETFNMLIPEALLILHPHKTSELRVEARFTLGDFNNGGFYLSGKYRQALKGKRVDIGAFEGSFFLTQHEPAYFFQNYQSNYLRWENELEFERHLKLEFNYLFRGMTTGARFYKLENFTLLGKDAKPIQAPTLSVLQLYLFKEFRIRTFSISNQLIYQKVSHWEALRLPEFMARVSLFFTLPVFNNASILQPGIDLFYNTAYYADAYMPAIRSFYIQNDKEIGNYVYGDLYLNLLLKKFKLFLKYQHLNSFFGNFTYYMVPHYPSQDGAFKFGVAWTFYD